MAQGDHEFEASAALGAERSGSADGSAGSQEARDAGACYICHIGPWSVGPHSASHGAVPKVWTPAMPSSAQVAEAASGWLGPDGSAEFRLVVGPGVVSTGLRPIEERLPAGLGEMVSAADRERAREALGLPPGNTVPDGRPGTDVVASRGVIAGWSPRSRSRMVRTFAEMDLAAVFSADRVPAMVTLTLPGDWLSVAPTAADFKTLVKAFRKRWQRRWGEPLRGLWKLEFQRRGAPHLHVMTVLPPKADDFHGWLSRTWAQVVAHPDPQERQRHELAGTGVDVADALRSRDPKRVAVYFSKHGAFGSKSYQDKPPVEWLKTGGTGRIWGVWGIERATAEVALTEREAIEVQRLLRRWEHAKAVRVQRKVWRPRPDRLDPETGELVSRGRWRRSGVRMGDGRRTGRAGSGFRVVNDGPVMASAIRRYVEAMREGRV